MKFSIQCLISCAFILLFAACNDHSHHEGKGQGHSHDSEDHEHKFEDMADRLEDPERDEWQKPAEVLDFIGDVTGKKVLDIGAGTGYFSFRLVDRGATVTAADISEKSIEYIENKKEETGTPDPKLKTKLIPPDNPAVNDNEFDLALIVNTYHHIENRAAYFNELLDVLKEDGILYVVDFKKIDLPIGPPLEMKLTAEEVVRELIEAGYSNIRVNSGLLKYQYIVTAHKKGANDVQEQ